MKKPSVLVLSVFMALLFYGCTAYCYEDTVSDMNIMYGSYFMSMSEYNPDGAAVSGYVWDGDPEKTDIVIPEKYGKQKIKCLGGYWGRGAPRRFYIDSDSYETAILPSGICAGLIENLFLSHKRCDGTFSVFTLARIWYTCSALAISIIL